MMDESWRTAKGALWMLENFFIYLSIALPRHFRYADFLCQSRREKHAQRAVDVQVEWMRKETICKANGKSEAECDIEIN